MSTELVERKRDLIAQASNWMSIDQDKFVDVIKKTILKQAGVAAVTDEDFMTFVSVCNEYKLNPLLKQIYAFKARSGGIEPMVPVDGWIKLVNANEFFNGFESEELFDDSGKFIAVKAIFHLKNRAVPITVTEYLDECSRPTEPWKKWPKRMLRHKAYIQGARVAFGFAAIYDEDEAERMKSVEVEVVKPKKKDDSTLAESKKQNIEDKKEILDLTQKVLDAATAKFGLERRNDGIQNVCGLKTFRGVTKESLQSCYDKLISLPDLKEEIEDAEQIEFPMGGIDQGDNHADV